MKKILLILLFLTLTISAAFAQQQMNRQKIKLLKTSYITDALSLTPKEAEKFWPVYNMYSDKIQNLKMSLEGGMHRDIKLAGGVENISENEAEKFIADIISMDQQITDNELKMIHELSKIISAKKIVTLKMAEGDFNRRILQEFGQRRRGQQGQ